MSFDEQTARYLREIEDLEAKLAERDKRIDAVLAIEMDARADVTTNDYNRGCATLLGRVQRMLRGEETTG